MNIEPHPPCSEPQTPIDWDAIRHRMHVIDEAFANDFKPPQDAQKRILKARAMELAKEPEQPCIQMASTEVVAFSLGSETYAVEASFVREIHMLKDFTPLPGLPGFVLGIASIRGEILSIIDLKKVFGLPEKGLGDLNRIVILHCEEMGFGILADAIIGNRTISFDTLQPPFPTASGIGEEYLRGVAGDQTIILDARGILHSPSIVIHQEAENAPQPIKGGI